jgi:phosphoribosyl 1,2-cyclic phosphodiesterase
MGGPYPESLKRRIAGRGGHLSNVQTAETLAEVLSDVVDSVVLCHLSEKNNAPHLAESEVLMHIGEYYSGSLSISKQEGPEFSNWLGQTDPEKVSSLT